MNTLLRKTLFLLLSTVFCLIPKAKSQVIGGQNVFSFLSLPQSARLTGLGGAQIAVRDDDPVFAINNPAALQIYSVCATMAAVLFAVMLFSKGGACRGRGAGAPRRGA